MANRLHVGTRKGLFELARSNGVWEIVDVQFLGDPVSAVLADADGSVWAALDLGHFGAKLWRRDRAGDVARDWRSRCFRQSRRTPATIRIPGRSARSGCSSRAGQPGACGPARCPAGSSAPTTAAHPGR